MSYITDPKGAQFGLFKTDTDPSDFTMCGQRFHTEDGREVVLVQNGTVALTAGKLLQHSPKVDNHLGLTVTAFTAASTTTGLPATIVATLGATVANQNQYQDGFVVVTEGTGLGQTLRISASTATAASGSITVTLEDSPVVALDTSSKISLIAAPYTGVVINPTTPTAGPCGISLYAIPASVANTYDGTSGVLTATGTYEYGFVMAKGLTSCLSDGGTTIGLGLAPAAGSVPGALATVAATTNQVASAYTAMTDTKYSLVFVNL